MAELVRWRDGKGNNRMITRRLRKLIALLTVTVGLISAGSAKIDTHTNDFASVTTLRTIEVADGTESNGGKGKPGRINSFQA